MNGILFTHGYFLEEDPREQEIMKPYPPLGILYVSAFLEKNGFPNEVFDSTFASMDLLKKKLLETRPLVVGIYSNLMTKLNVLKIIRFIRGHENLQHTRIVLGGPEVRNHAPKFIEHGADFLVLGEGEESMLELVLWIHRQPVERSSSAELPSHIPGIAYRDVAGELSENAARILLKNLDELPLPARNKIDLSLYFNAWKTKHGENAISVSTMRGCPYTCRWCSRAVYGQTYRRRSPGAVADELQHLLQTYSFDTIWFVDDVFTISHEWLKKFHAEVVTRKLALKYECITRADRLNEEVLKLLAESGCFRVWIGAESGSQKILDAMDRRVEASQVREMIHLAGKNGIQTGTFIMVGYPGETEEDILETIDHLKAAKPDFYTLTLTYPIKGTPLYAEVEPTFAGVPVWAETTDRQLDFERTYPRRYYDYAIRYIHNELAFHRVGFHGRGLPFQRYLLKVKSLVARAGMLRERRFHSGGK